MAHLAQQASHARLQFRERRAGIDAERGAQDHPQRNALHGGVGAHFSAARPLLGGGQRFALHGIEEGAHAFALQRWQQYAALASVGRVIEHQHRAFPNQGRQHRVTFAGMQYGGVAAKHFADILGPSQMHQGAEAGQAHAEGLAKARAVFQKSERPEGVAQELYDRVLVGTRRQGKGSGHGAKVT